MIAKREELRKNYDHYDRKMEDLYKSNKKAKTDDVLRVNLIINIYQFNFYIKYN